MNVTATEAKNRLGQVLEHAKVGPVFIEKAGRPHSVVMGVAQYESLLLRAQSASGADSASGKRFYAEYREWVDELNRLVEAHGVFGEEWRPW